MDKSIMNSLKISVILLIVCLFIVQQVNAIEKESQDCPPQLKSFCRCGNSVYNDLKPNRNVYLTNCSFSNIQNLVFLHYLPIETEVLLLNNNNLTSLPANLLNTPEHYKNLEVIDFSFNQIQSIHNDTLKNLTQLRILNLNHNNLLITENNFHPKLFSDLNNLESLHISNAFDELSYSKNFFEDLFTIFQESNLQKLKILNLAENHFRSLSNPLVFCKFPSLQKLYLNKNLLVDQLEFNFSCIHNLLLLDLSENLITKLSNTSIKTFEDSKLLFHLNLTNNPFNCDCELIDFHKWLRETKIWIIESETLQCTNGYPESNIGKQIVSLNNNDFLCKDQDLDSEKIAYRRHLMITCTIAISLIASLIVLLLAVLFLSRKSISFYWRELSNSIAKKRDYVPLEKDNKTVVGQATDCSENKTEETEKQQKSASTQLNSTEIDEDVV